MAVFELAGKKNFSSKICIAGANTANDNSFKPDEFSFSAFFAGVLAPFVVFAVDFVGDFDAGVFPFDAAVDFFAAPFFVGVFPPAGVFVGVFVGVFAGVIFVDAVDLGGGGANAVVVAAAASLLALGGASKEEVKNEKSELASRKEEKPAPPPTSLETPAP